MTKLRDNLLSARKCKKDEFFTQYETVESELSNYKSILKNKIVYLNCDDDRSAFFRYFEKNFDEFELKKLIATCYNPLSYGFKFEKERNCDVKKYELKGDGSFLSQECIDILKECDFVTTNPPFSLWRQYIELVNNYNKQFVILGSLNCVSYKNVFTLLMNNKIQLGYSEQNQLYYFFVPSNYKVTTNFSIEKEGKTLLPVMNCCWFTNVFDLQVGCKQRNMFCFTENSPCYTEDIYFKYLNYDAINVDRVKNIPNNYYEEIGVPLTYLCVHNKNLFDIVGSNSYNIEQIRECSLHFEQNGVLVDTKKLGNALFVKLKEQENTKKKYWDDNGNYYKAPYARIFIKRKKN